MNETRRPIIFDIKRYTLDDGPGIRTTVFFKGCPLSCAWCHNPESLRPDPEISWHRSGCIGCGECAKACNQQALSEGTERLDRMRCTACGACVAVCPSTALKQVGRYYSEDELTSILLKDKIFYEVSGGGVTFSGGEPTLHMEYLGGLLRKLKKNGVHTLLQTCGMFDPVEFRQMLLPYLDRIYFDIKFIDADEHLRFTSRSNDLILKNLALLTKQAPNKLLPRIPLVPNFTAAERNLRNIGNLLKTLEITNFKCLPYNPGGIAKRKDFGYPVSPSLPPAMMSVEEELRWTEVLKDEIRPASNETILNSKEEHICRSIFTMR